MNTVSKYKIRIGTVIFGVFTAMVIIFGQLFYFQAAAHAKKEVKNEVRQETQNGDQQADDDNQAFISQPAGSLPAASAQVEINHESFCIQEILFEDVDIDYPQDRIPLYIGKLFHTLFRTLISPNAP